MIWFYVAAAIFGGVFLVPMVLAGLDVGGIDVDGAGADLDGGGGLELEADGDLPSLEAEGGGDLDADLGGGALGAISPAWSRSAPSSSSARSSERRGWF